MSKNLSQSIPVYTVKGFLVVRPGKTRGIGSGVPKEDMGDQPPLRRGTKVLRMVDEQDSTIKVPIGSECRKGLTRFLSRNFLVKKKLK